MSENMRHVQIVVLLDTRDDNLPLPIVRVAHSAGFAHRVRVRLSCEDCLANGRVMKTCESCGGRGYVEEWRSRDPYAKSETLAYGIDRNDDHRHLGHVPARDAEIDRLDQQLRDPWQSAADELAEANKRGYAWEEARKAMYRNFDYRSLDVALEQLAKAHPGVSPRSSQGLSFIDALMPEEIRVPRSQDVDGNATTAVPIAKADPRLERDARIRELAAATEKMSAAEIAVACGCSLKTVYRALEPKAA